MLNILQSTLADMADFFLGALPCLAALAGLSGIILVPLWLLARSVGAI